MVLAQFNNLVDNVTLCTLGIAMSDFNHGHLGYAEMVLQGVPR